MTGRRSGVDIVEIGNVEVSSVNFTYMAGEDINTVWNGKYLIIAAK